MDDVVKKSNTYSVNKGEYIWAEKYRPYRFHDLILPESYHNMFHKYLFVDKQIPNIMFYGEAGIGKTSMTDVIIRELEASVLELNGSVETSVNEIRDRIDPFCRRMSLLNSDVPKIIVINEGERISDSFKAGLKDIIEKYSAYARFIIATNHIYSIKEKALTDRFVKINPAFVPEIEKKAVILKMLNKLAWILKEEDVKYSKEALRDLAIAGYPSFRNVLMGAQFLYDAYGEVTKSLTSLSDLLFNEDSFKLIKNPSIEAWIELRKTTFGIDTEVFFKAFYEKYEKRMPDPLKPEVIKLLNVYDRANFSVTNKENNIMAFYTDLRKLMNGQWLEV